jgi:hypothetical protein
MMVHILNVMVEALDMAAEHFHGCNRGTVEEETNSSAKSKLHNAREDKEKLVKDSQILVVHAWMRDVKIIMKLQRHVLC